MQQLALGGTLMFMDSSRNALLMLQQFGQSVWLNELPRQLLREFRLQKLMEEDGVTGIAPFPLDLNTVLVHDSSYAREILSAQVGTDAAAARETYEHMQVQDTREAADAFRGMYARSEGRYGIVCFPSFSSPAADSSVILSEARRLWRMLDRSNVMMSVPASPAGLTALRQLLSDGISVNVTLLCTVKRYLEVLDCFAGALEERLKAQRPLTDVTTLASFCVGPIDALVNAKLESIRNPPEMERAHAYLRKAGTGVACFAYQELRKFTASPRWRALAARGAKVQRLLWAQVNSQSAAEENLRCIDDLIGPETISAISLATLGEYRHRGRPRPSLLEANLYETAVLPSELSRFGIDLESIGDRAQSELLRDFAAVIDASVDQISARRAAL